jgi:hypothetical protein
MASKQSGAGSVTLLAFLKKNRRWVMGGLAVLLVLGGLGWQMYGGDWRSRTSCLSHKGDWKDGVCTLH